MEPCHVDDQRTSSRVALLPGYTSMGKTAAAIEIGLAARSGKRVLFVSCEMSPDEIGITVAQRWGLSGRRFYAGRARLTTKRAVDRALGWKRTTG